MFLLIDAGNTRIKWALAKNDHIIQEGALRHDQVKELAKLSRFGKIHRALGSLVASQAVGQAIIEAIPLPIRWVKGQKEKYGIYNHYVDPNTQGVDRWLALLGVAEKIKGDIVLASLGTALTVEALREDGHYLGGIIAPGKHMMLESLISGTALIQNETGQYACFPTTTPDGITTGSLDALAGAITRFRDRFAKYRQKEIEVILTGGDASLVLPLIQQPCRIINNLVIQGLLRIAKTDY